MMVVDDISTDKKKLPNKNEHHDTTNNNNNDDCNDDDDNDDNNNVFKNNSHNKEEYINLLDSRIECIERINGIPNRNANSIDKLCMWITYQINHKLAIFGIRLGCYFAIIVAICNVAFVIGFTYWQTSICTPNMGFIDGDFSPSIYKQIYKNPGNVFICTTEYDNTNIPSLIVDEQESNVSTIISSSYYREFLNDNNELISCSNRVPCTLVGFTANNDYDINKRICPISHGGCRPYNCINTVTNQPHPPKMNYDFFLTNRTKDKQLYDFDEWIPPYESCDNIEQEETLCSGSTSITYYVCPLIGTVIGAAFGYLFIIEIFASFTVIMLYFICSGKRYTFNDLGVAYSAPTGTLEQVRSKRMSLEQQQEKKNENNNNSIKSANNVGGGVANNNVGRNNNINDDHPNTDLTKHDESVEDLV